MLGALFAPPLFLSYPGYFFVMKIAISGKGGVGKTVLAAFLCKTLSEHGYSVIAIDADPDSNLAATIGFPHPEEIVPISEMSDLIKERTGARPGESASLFKLSPKVDDIPEKYAAEYNGIKLMVMGRIKRGGTGCYCPEGSLLQALLAHLLIARDEAVILDMEAGVEHLGRGTARAVDKLIVVVEPGRRSLETALRIGKLARDIGLENIAMVGSKIRDKSQEKLLMSSLPGFEFIGFIPYDKALVDADLAELPVLESGPRIAGAVEDIYQALTHSAKAPTATN